MGILGAAMLDVTSFYCYAECSHEKGSYTALSRTVRNLGKNSQKTYKNFFNY
jgi:hypothetical protein